MTSYARDGKVGPWAAEKLECLRKYLAAYTTVLRKQPYFDGYIYFDAFAGAGTAELRKRKRSVSDDDLFEHSQRDDPDVREYIDGSPRIALGIEHPFKRYIFVEADADRATQLEKLQDEFPKLSIRVIKGDANVALRRCLVENQRVNWRKWRGVVFLDPFGLQVPWSTIDGLGRTRALEVIINFPVGTAIQRLLPNNRLPTEKIRHRLESYFGTDEWLRISYNFRRGLFGEEVSKFEDADKRLVRWYRGRLNELFGYAAAPRLIRNSRGSPLYFLLFAGPNATGAKIANDVLKQGEAVR